MRKSTVRSEEKRSKEVSKPEGGEWAAVGEWQSWDRSLGAKRPARSCLSQMLGVDLLGLFWRGSADRLNQDESRITVGNEGGVGSARFNWSVPG
jgi:hypothetical protein